MTDEKVEVVRIDGSALINEALRLLGGTMKHWVGDDITKELAADMAVGILYHHRLKSIHEGDRARFMRTIEDMASDVEPDMEVN